MANNLDELPKSKPDRQAGKPVSVKVTKFGEGKVSTGEHVAVQGDVMAKVGQILSVPPSVAKALEAKGLAEIQ